MLSFYILKNDNKLKNIVMFYNLINYPNIFLDSYYFPNVIKIHNYWKDKWYKRIDITFVKNDIKIGFLVKICNEYERFWIEVIKLTNQFVYGKIENNLIAFNPPYNFGDIVRCKYTDIIEVLSETDFDRTDVIVLHPKI
jgi:hypothetical protein